MVTILIVDDEPEVRNVYCTALEYAGFTVEVAETGLAALKTARNRVPDVIVCDLRLPDISGVETVRRLLAIAPDVRVILTSGDAQTLADAENELDVFNLLVKPFRLAQLVEAVRRELDLATH